MAQANDQTHHSVAAPYFQISRQPDESLACSTGEPSAGAWTLALSDTSGIGLNGEYRPAQLTLSRDAVPPASSATWSYVDSVQGQGSPRRGGSLSVRASPPEDGRSRLSLRALQSVDSPGSAQSL